MRTILLSVYLPSDAVDFNNLGIFRKARTKRWCYFTEYWANGGGLFYQRQKPFDTQRENRLIMPSGKIIYVDQTGNYTNYGEFHWSELQKSHAECFLFPENGKT